MVLKINHFIVILLNVILHSIYIILKLVLGIALVMTLFKIKIKGDYLYQILMLWFWGFLIYSNCQMIETRLNEIVITKYHGQFIDYFKSPSDFIKFIQSDIHLHSLLIGLLHSLTAILLIMIIKTQAVPLSIILAECHTPYVSELFHIVCALTLLKVFGCFVSLMHLVYVNSSISNLSLKRFNDLKQHISSGTPSRKCVIQYCMKAIDQYIEI